MPIVPWRQEWRHERLLKKTTPVMQVESSGSQRHAPTMASKPRGSLMRVVRTQSASFSRKSRVALAPRGVSRPETMVRVGSPPVWESIIFTLMKKGARRELQGTHLIYLPSQLLHQFRKRACWSWRNCFWAGLN